MINVTGLTKRYGEHTVVDDLTFALEDNRIYGMLGPNGAGKTTTIRMLTGCLFPDEGTITIDGYDIVSQPMQARKCIGYLPEIPPLFPAMTPREYLMFAAGLKGIGRQEGISRVETVMEKTGIAHMADRLIGYLSKGYRQRVGIAQAILGTPRLIVLDEPFVGLDPTQIVELRELIAELGEGHIVLFSSHILSEVSVLCSDLLVLSSGHLLASGKTDDLCNADGSSTASLEEAFLSLLKQGKEKGE